MGDVITNQVVCAMCEATFDPGTVLEQEYYLCPECKKTYEGMAAVLCTKCNTVVAMVRPGMNRLGYLVNPGAILHVTECPKCKPGVTTSMPIEFQ